jgi:hypothetical protein
MVSVTMSSGSAAELEDSGSSLGSASALIA